MFTLCATFCSSSTIGTAKKRCTPIRGLETAKTPSNQNGNISGRRSLTRPSVIAFNCHEKAHPQTPQTPCSQGVDVTGKKSFASVVVTGNNSSPVSLSMVTYRRCCWHQCTLICKYLHQFSKTFETAHWEDTDSWKNLKSKILWKTPFMLFLVPFYALEVIYVNSLIFALYICGFLEWAGPGGTSHSCSAPTINCWTSARVSEIYWSYSPSIPGFYYVNSTNKGGKESIYT